MYPPLRSRSRIFPSLQKFPFVYLLRQDLPILRSNHYSDVYRHRFINLFWTSIYIELLAQIREIHLFLLYEYAIIYLADEHVGF